MEYPKTEVNRLGRLAARGSYDYATIHGIVNAAPILHVSFVDPDHAFPVVLPMLGCTGNFSAPDADPAVTAQDIYLHGYVSGRMFRKAGEASDGDVNDNSEEGKEEQEKGLPITLAASLLDGLVLALSPFHNSCNYRSATLYGHAQRITSAAEKLYALQRITDSLLPERWENSRQPPTPAELSSTSVLRVRVQSASAKVRRGGPSEDRADLGDGALRERVWTGVVPYWGVWGEAVPARENRCEELEGYIEGWRIGENGKARVGAFEAVEGG